MAASPSDRRRGSAAGGWVRGMRFSGFTLIMMGLAVLAVIVLAPTVRDWVAQRQQIAAMQNSVADQKQRVQHLTDERERWTDKTFITTQARDRLGYVMPGEVSLLVINDLPALQATKEPAPVSSDLQTTETDWLHSLFASTLTAALAPPQAEPNR